MLTLKVHEAPIASVAPDKLITLLPAVAVIVPPAQEPISPFGVAIFRGLGNVSKIPMLVLEIVFVLVMVKLRLEIPVAGMLFGVNVLVNVGPCAHTSVVEVITSKASP